MKARLLRVLAIVLCGLVVGSVAAWATGSLTIPNTIFTQPGGTNVAPLIDANNAAIASYINGHEITFGLLAARPVAGTAGRYYFATDQLIYYADNGVSWTQLGPAVNAVNLSGRTGLTLANNGTSTNSITIAAGAAVSDDATIANRVAMTLTSALTKKPGTAWAVGTSQGCLDTGAAATFTFYHVFVIQRTDTGVVDVLCSTSATAPTMPTNYTKKQRLGAVRSTWFATPGAEYYFFSQVRNRFRWATLTSTLDVNNATPGAGTSVTATLSVPNGVVVKALVQCVAANTSQVYVSELSAADETVTVTGPMNCAAFTANFGVQVDVVTNASQQIRYQNIANVLTTLRTYGWEELWD
jgi:hypothetical protein